MQGSAKFDAIQGFTMFGLRVLLIYADFLSTAKLA